MTRYHVSTAANTVVIDHPADSPAAVLVDLHGRALSVSDTVFLQLVDAETGAQCLVGLGTITVIEESLP